MSSDKPVAWRMIIFRHDRRYSRRFSRLIPDRSCGFMGSDKPRTGGRLSFVQVQEATAEAFIVGRGLSLSGRSRLTLPQVGKWTVHAWMVPVCGTTARRSQARK
ncbi:hypothetical protein [Acetobacter estunensis]|uniref:hypothetical protein n=1 Tax=Acetobacter estunensis TaxID=104097 RepID=UPI00222F641D|nr:hypothetical protein [Acetobacter estunensis]